MGRVLIPLPVATVVEIVPPASHRGRGTTPECIPVVRPIRELTIEVLLLNALISGVCTLLANLIGLGILLLHILDRYNRQERQHLCHDHRNCCQGYEEDNPVLHNVSLPGSGQQISPSHIIYPCYLDCNLYLEMSEKKSDVTVTRPGNDPVLTRTRESISGGEHPANTCGHCCR